MAENNNRRAQNTTARISRYLESILKVNQELVAAKAGASASAPSAARQSTTAKGTGEASRLQRRKVTRKKRISGIKVGGAFGGVGVGAEVAETLRVGEAGGNPVPSLRALYERIGFCALQGEDEDGGTTSLPTSPSRSRVKQALVETGSHGERDGFSSTEHPGSIEADSFFSKDPFESMWSPGKHATTQRSEGRRAGKESTAGANNYSFAHSPSKKMVSVAERSPKVVRRLEALASQLEREKADVEQWYTTVVRRVSAIIEKQTSSVFYCVLCLE